MEKSKIRLSLFLYSKFGNSEISAERHLVVPNVDPHPKFLVARSGFYLGFVMVSLHYEKNATTLAYHCASGRVIFTRTNDASATS